MARKLLQVLASKPEDAPLWPPPVWIMRQAGRYLPEYRQVRAKAGSFLDLCYTPALAKEVTLQPIRRFGFDGAILFSDILVVPDALGRRVCFEKGVGPLLEPIKPGEIHALEAANPLSHLAPVLQAVSDIRAALPDETTLLGFCGAPWTVATYMVAGRGEKDQLFARRFACQHREAFLNLLDILTGASITYLNAQIKAGADAVQVFDSWSGVLNEEDFTDFCLKPMARIVAGVKAEYPATPVIGFPKGANLHYSRYITKTRVDCAGLDWTYPLPLAREELSKHAVIQGNLDPVRLLAGGSALETSVSDILKTMRGTRFIFNLGHGVQPETPPEHVAAMVAQIRQAK